MNPMLNNDFLDSLFPPERTDDFFEALFGGAEEGAYTIMLRLRSETETSVELAFELHQRPGKCLVCNLTYGLPQVFQRHPVLNVAGVARAIAEKLGLAGLFLGYWHNTRGKRGTALDPLPCGPQGGIGSLTPLTSKGRHRQPGSQGAHCPAPEPRAAAKKICPNTQKVFDVRGTLG